MEVTCDYCPSLGPLNLAQMRAHYYAMHAARGRQEVCDWEWRSWYALVVAPGQFPQDGDYGAGGGSNRGGGAFPSLKRSRCSDGDDVAADGLCVGAVGAGVGEDSNVFSGLRFPDAAVASESAPTGRKRARDSRDAGNSGGTVVIPSAEQCVVAARSPSGKSTTMHRARKHVFADVDVKALLAADSRVCLRPETCVVDVFRDGAIPAFEEQLAEFASWSPLRQVRAVVVSV